MDGHLNDIDDQREMRDSDSLDERLVKGCVCGECSTFGLPVVPGELRVKTHT